MIRLDDHNTHAFLEEDALNDTLSHAWDAHLSLLHGTGAGSDMRGWRRLLLDPNDALLEDLKTTAARIRRDADVLLCLGIGGSYLGAQAVIEALTPYWGKGKEEKGKGEHEKKTQRHVRQREIQHPTSNIQHPEILFAGHHLSGAYLQELLDYLEGKSVYVNVISKSGTTLETALAFRFVRSWMEEHFDDADARIIVTTDPSEGALNELQHKRGYKKYVIPRDVGGRFSVLTPVGLLPIAAAGIDVRALFYGAASACEQLDRLAKADAPGAAALRYAALRYLLLQAGYAVEALAVFEPRLADLGAWWQQLFGESEGKEHTALYPATVQYSTDLHSLGQFMQEGTRTVVETFLMAEHDGGDLTVPETETDLDGLNYLAGKTISHVTRKAYEGTAEAHTEGGVPNLTFWIDRIAPEPLGALLYTFEHAVAVSGYLLGVNPFNQPGVEAYKSAMFRLLGRP